MTNPAHQIIPHVDLGQVLRLRLGPQHVREALDEGQAHGGVLALGFRRCAASIGEPLHGGKP